MNKLFNSNLAQRCVIGLLVVLNLLFLYYWIMLSANYCMHFDDVHYLWKLRDISGYDYMREMYMTRGGNFVSYGLNVILFTISNWIGAYRFWPMVFYVVGILITWGVFRNAPWMKQNKRLGLLGVVTLYNLYILTSPDYAVFTWICAAVFYLYAPLICAHIYYLLKDNLKWYQWIGLIAVSISIAGLSVSLSTVSFVIMFALGMWMWYKEKWNVRNTWHNPKVKRLLGITALMLICFAIVYVAPGNWARMANEPDIQQPANLMEFAKAIAVCITMFMYLMAFYLPYHLIALALGAGAGSKYPMSLPMGRSKAIWMTLIIAVAYLVVSVVPLAYLSNGFAIQRNYHPICFFYIFTFFMLGYIWVSGARKEKKLSDVWIYRCINICAIFLIVIMMLNIRQDLPVARAYKQAHEEREAYLLELQRNGNKETVTVAPYPSVQTPDAKYNVLKWLGKSTPMPAINYESDVDFEPNEYEYHIRKLYHLDFDFVLEEENRDNGKFDN